EGAVACGVELGGEGVQVVTDPLPAEGRAEQAGVRTCLLLEASADDRQLDQSGPPVRARPPWETVVDGFPRRTCRCSFRGSSFGCERPHSPYLQAPTRSRQFRQKKRLRGSSYRRWPNGLPLKRPPCQPLPVRRFPGYLSAQ